MDELSFTRNKLRQLARIVKQTLKTLSQIIQHNKWPPQQAADQRAAHFSDTLDHIGQVREGFMLSQRTSSQADLAELRWLIKDVLLDWNWIHDLDLIITPAHKIELPQGQLVVYNHATVALAVLPRLPIQAITFPQQSPTYSDVFPPRLPAEMLARIEEIEQIIYRIEIGAWRDLAYAPFRRTYAFFEASHWLVNSYLNPILND
ncbi:MAG: hypothetical protein R3264_18555 [Anaerolineae bacterium]|nr:hypothetical protein [Anaerolineae bacterium]